VALPPVTPPGFVGLFATPSGDADAAAGAVSEAIHTWMTSGKAAPAAGGAAVPWK
jgi:hypothetical protein